MNRAESINFLKEFKHEELIKKSWFIKVQKEVKAIIFYGSRSKETNREDSDFDLLVILPLEIEKKFTEGEYIYLYKGKEINIVLRSIEKLRQIAKEKNDEFQKEVFRKSEIIYESDNEVSKLLNEIEEI